MSEFCVVPGCVSIVPYHQHKYAKMSATVRDLSNQIEELQHTIRDLKRQLKEVEAELDAYKVTYQHLQNAPHPEYYE